MPRGQQDPEQFFNTAAFVLQPFGAFGNAGRNTVIGPGMINWDFSTLKNFNIPNHPNWGDLTTNVLNSNYGKIRGTRTNMRELQFGLKYTF